MCKRNLSNSKPLLKEGKPKGWVLYDGSCGFCSWWVLYLRRTILKAGYDTASIHSEWTKEALGISEADLNKDIRILLNNGTLIVGADAYIYGMKQVYWARPFGLFFSLPILSVVFRLCYKIFNRNRFFISKVCRLKPEN